MGIVGLNEEFAAWCVLSWTDCAATAGFREEMTLDTTRRSAMLLAATLPVWGEALAAAGKKHMHSIDSPELAALDERFFAALERGDADTVRACYTPDVIVWHNYDERELTGAEHVGLLESYFFARYHDRRYVDVRRYLLPNGILRLHTLQAKLADGKDVRMLICILCLVQDGRISRIDEYITETQPAA